MMLLIRLIPFLFLGFNLAAEERPNFLIIITDDQRYDDLDQFMPITKSRIFDQGIRFNKAYVTNPSCCPSRASILTGQYNSVNKVLTNQHVLKRDTFIRRLKSRYFLGHIGKYLNTHSGKKIRFYDYWVAFRGGSSPYNDPKLVVQDNPRTKVPGYITYLFRDYALEFLDQAKQQEQPFILYLAFNAPHSFAVAAKEDFGIFDHIPIKQYPNYNPTRADKIKNLRPKWLWSRNTSGSFQKFARRQRESLASVDRSIGTILDKLEELEFHKDTVVFFLSDNGILRGEHGLVSKQAAYEEAIKVPFAIKYPNGISTPRVDNESLVANIDIAPTVYSLARNAELDTANGKSLEELFENSNKDFRSHLLIESWRKTFKGKRTNKVRNATRLPFAGLHTGDMVYIRNYRFRNDKDKHVLELYDLNQDPFQTKNLILDSNYQTQREFYHTTLNTMLKKYRKTTSLNPKDIKNAVKR